MVHLSFHRPVDHQRIICVLMSGGPAGRNLSTVSQPSVGHHLHDGERLQGAPTDSKGWLTERLRHHLFFQPWVVITKRKKESYDPRLRRDAAKAVPIFVVTWMSVILMDSSSSLIQVHHNHKEKGPDEPWLGAGPEVV